MSYLFGFSGRINRAKMWLFIPIAIVWWIAIAAIAIFGLHWTHFIEALRAFKATVPYAGRPPMPCPDAIGGTGWIALAGIVIMMLLYVWAKFAVFVKRLHDRGKSAWWLIPYWLVPAALHIYVRVSEHMARVADHAARVADHVARVADHAVSTAAIHPHFLMLYAHLGVPQKIALGVAMLIGFWVFIELYFFRGTAGENKYGPDPLAR